MRKKGDFTGVLFLIISIAAFAFFLIIVGFITPQIMNPMKNAMGHTTEINKSFDASINVAEHTLPTIWMIIFGGLMLGLFVTAWFIPSHPIFVPVFAILLVATIIVAIPLSNAYESLSQKSELTTAASQQSLIGFFMLKLPYVAFVVGIVILIVSYAKPSGYGGGGSAIPV